MTIQIDRAHPTKDELNAGTAQRIPQPQIGPSLSCGDLVQPHPFHEPCSCVDQRHSGLVWPELTGRPHCRSETRVAGTENHNVMSHRPSPSVHGGNPHQGAAD
jgi:hypothetical protein